MKPVLVCLHGWGGSGESFTELRDVLKDADIDILAPDMPGFGREAEMTRPWTNDDYTDWVEQYIRKNVSGHFHLLGHSHGGRISIKLAARKTLPIDHLYLCAPAGIRRGQYLKRAIGWVIAKSGKLLLSLPVFANHLEPLARKLFYRLLRTHDYEQASAMMRQTMVQVTSENMRPLLPLVTVPTDIFWGTDDSTTPYGDGLIAEKEIKGSVLHSYPGIRHRVHRDKAKEIAEVIMEQMKRE